MLIALSLVTLLLMLSVAVVTFGGPEMPSPLRNIEAVRRPCTVIAGLDDDLFYIRIALSRSSAASVNRGR